MTDAVKAFCYRKDKASYRFYLQQDVKKRMCGVWYLMVNPPKLPEEIVRQKPAFLIRVIP